MRWGAWAAIAALVLAGGASAASDAGEATAIRMIEDRRASYAEPLEYALGVSPWCQYRYIACRNEWSDVRGEKPPTRVIVHAGAEKQPDWLPPQPDRGVVVVRVFRWDPWVDDAGGLGSVGHHAAPPGVGSLIITRVSGRHVLLRASTSERLVFDLGTRRFSERR